MILTKWISPCPNCLRSNSKSSLEKENTIPNFKVSLLLFTHNIWHSVKNNQILCKDKSAFKNGTKQKIMDFWLQPGEKVNKSSP